MAAGRPSGFRGVFVISWAQTELDGIAAPPRGALSVGATWRWTGEPVRVDGPAELLLLHDAETEAERRRRAGRVVRRLMGAAVRRREPAGILSDTGVPEEGFVVTDGRASYAVTLIEVPESAARLLMFSGGLPPRDAELWVVSRFSEGGPAAARPAQGVICFTPGTLIRTPGGERPVEAIRPGDRVLTRDDGPQVVQWTGRRRMSGARLHAMPALRPVRIAPGALGIDRPEPELVVSPGHRVLMRGAAVRALFQAEEVLVAARDLEGMPGIRTDTRLPDVTYIHLMTERHEIVWANGIETESFHPASTDLALVDPGQRAVLYALFPDLEADPARYGAHARRGLTRPEAAILRHRAA